MIRPKHVVLSFLCGTGILVITLVYQNYDYSLSVEDGFIKKMFVVKDLIYSSPSQAKADFVFVNTGKDLALVADTFDYGEVAVTDRAKVYRLMSYINTLPAKPLFSVIDIEFYFPFSIDPSIDTLLQEELEKNDRTVIPILKLPGEETYKQPLYKVRYAYSNYRTFGPAFNKFRIMNQGSIASIPLILDAEINHRVYKDHLFYPTCNGRLCLSAIWPNYYLRNDDLTGLSYKQGLEGIPTEDPHPRKGNVTAQYYNIGEMLFDIEGDSAKYNYFFDGKIVIVGNFEQDVHSTPVGKMAGPVLLANIYLSLANGQHLLSFWLIATLVVAFSALSYIALFGRMPEIKFNFRFLFSSYLVKFIRGYISYFGCMFLLSMIVLLLFNLQVALFLPSLIFTWIEYVRHKKYKTNLVGDAPATVDKV